jgi:hypothetical protein
MNALILLFVLLALPQSLVLSQKQSPRQLLALQEKLLSNLSPTDTATIHSLASQNVELSTIVEAIGHKKSAVEVNDLIELLRVQENDMLNGVGDGVKRKNVITSNKDGIRRSSSSSNSNNTSNASNKNKSGKSHYRSKSNGKNNGKNDRDSIGDIYNGKGSSNSKILNDKKKAMEYDKIPEYKKEAESKAERRRRKR